MTGPDERSRRRQARRARLGELTPEAAARGFPPSAQPPQPTAAADDDPDATGTVPSVNQVTLEACRDRFGMPDASPDEILAELDARLAERQTAAPPPMSELDVAALARAGIVVVDRAGFEELRDMHPDKVAARHRVEREERAVDAAIRRGAIAPAKRAAWLRSMAAGPDTPEYEQALAAIPDQAEVPLEPIGHALGFGDDHVQADFRHSDVYSSWKV